jgi:hypothetical protein
MEHATGESPPHVALGFNEDMRRTLADHREPRYSRPCYGDHYGLQLPAPTTRSPAPVSSFDVLVSCRFKPVVASQRKTWLW